MLRLLDTLTYWVPTGRTGGGGVQWAAGVSALSRNADSEKQINRPDGQVEVGKKVFYTRADIPVGARVAAGNLAGTASPPADGAYRVAQVSSVPSLNNIRAVWGV